MTESSNGKLKNFTFFLIMVVILDRGHGDHLGWKTWWHQTFAMACVIMYGIKTYNVLHYIFHTQIQEIR
jgi:hypothetical protein